MFKIEPLLLNPIFKMCKAHVSLRFSTLNAVTYFESYYKGIILTFWLIWNPSRNLLVTSLKWLDNNGDDKIVFSIIWYCLMFQGSWKSSCYKIFKFIICSSQILVSTSLNSPIMYSGIFLKDLGAERRLEYIYIE